MASGVEKSQGNSYKIALKKKGRSQAAFDPTVGAASSVVDASVAINWFLPDIHSDAALRLLVGQHTLHVPDLIFSEFETFSGSAFG
jgi:hypothetical protein